MGKLILLGAVVAIADPILLIFIYSYAGIEALLAALFLPPILGSRLVAWSKIRAQRNAAENVAGGFGDQVLLTAAGFMFSYPGPISTVLGALLLIQPVRRWVQAWATKRIMKAVAGGNLSVLPGMGGVGAVGGVAFSSMGGMDGFNTQAPSGPLKRAEGTVVEDRVAPQLDAPAAPQAAVDPSQRP